MFGSEIKSVLQHTSVSRDLNWTAIDAFFTYGYIPAPWTAYRDIHKLEAGHYLIADEHGVPHRTLLGPLDGAETGRSAGDLQAEFIERFRECVGMRMLSEVPLGAFLSGGVDSSMLVAMMAQASDRPINTSRSALVERPGAFSTSVRSRARSASDTRPTTGSSKSCPRVAEAVDVALEAFDEPFADDSLIPTHHICALARRHVTVALTGLGGDEAFAGYERYLGFRLSQTASQFPWQLMLRAAAPLVNSLREEGGGHYRVNHLKRFVAAAELPPAERWQRYQALFPADFRRTLYRPAIASQIDFEAVDQAGRRYYDQCDATDPLDRALYQDIKMYLPDDILALTDRVGMWHSLELRVPFIDHTLLEFCARIPSKLKLRRGEKKYLLREASRSLILRIGAESSQAGICIADGDLVARRPARLRRIAPVEEALGQVGVLDATVARSLFQAHQDRRSLNDKQVFALLMFQRWSMRLRNGAGLPEPAAAAACVQAIP